ncbi:MAG: LptF/LptG family permease [Alphaproteobacteria bacterium]|nr:LptF/LptG family permease [Alphaproteobacteria bacterium]
MKIFGLLSRYVSRSFLVSFCGTLTCLFSIILLFDFAELQRRAGNKDISLAIKLKMILLRSPNFLEQILPFLFFAAALFIFWRMNRSNELLIFRSVGISLWRIILPISLTALMIGFIDLSAFNPLSSVMQKRYEKLEKRYLSKTKEDIKLTSTGLWLSEKIGPNQALYRADKIDLNTMTFLNLNIIITSPDNKFVERLDAKTAQIQGNDLVLKEGWETHVGKSTTSFAEKKIKTSLNKNKIEEMRVSRATFSFWNLPPYISLLEASGLHSLKYQMYWHSMLAGTFWLGAMIFLAAAFSCRPHRQGKTALILLGGLIVGFALYFFKDIAFALGASGRLPPVIAAWLPPLLTFMVGAVLVFNQEDG